MPSVMTSLTAALAALDHVVEPGRSTGGGAAGPTAGVVLAHCAASIDGSLDGYPRLKPAVLRATIGRLVKRRFLSRGAMKHNTAAGLPGLPPLSGHVPLADAKDQLKRAIARFHAHDGPLHPHPVFGACSKLEYDQLHALHIADHLARLPSAASSTPAA